MLSAQLGIEGCQFVDPLDARRYWRVEGAYMPIPGRAIGGIRAKVRDQKDFVSFCNQRDLEVLLGLARPGELCPWLDDDYVDVTEEAWVGLACDDTDLLDDLYEREWMLRSQLPLQIITPDYEIARRVHLAHHADVEDLFVLLADIEPETGAAPDVRFDTLEGRWMRAERKRVRWEKS
jgi:hypothetical protein